MNRYSDTLIIIPARGGSKGIPNKNIRPLCNKPLILYTVEAARNVFQDEQICVSTDSEKIMAVVEQTGLNVPFIRPGSLATDTASTYGVLLHAIEHYKGKNMYFSKVLLLQPTSPFRTRVHLEDIFKTYDNSIDMAVSVGISHQNPYFSLFEEDGSGYLVKSKSGNYERRQDCPPAYYYNGSMYLIKTEVLEQKNISQFTRVKKYVMEEKYCLDIDTPLDWLICETLIEKGLYTDADN